MSNPFTTADIDNMREAQEIHAYTDTALYIPAPGISSLDEYGQPTASTQQILIDCAFVDTAKTEQWKQADIEAVEAEIYFAAPAPQKGGKFKIVSRFGQPVTEQTFEIIGIQNRGAFGFVCALKAVSI